MNPTERALMNMPESTSEETDKKIQELHDSFNTVNQYSGQYHGLVNSMKDSDYYKPAFLSIFQNAGTLDGSPESVGRASHARALLSANHSDDESAQRAIKILDGFVDSATAHQTLLPDNIGD